MIRKILSALLICASFFTNAQELSAVTDPQMADKFREDGKIYVVITVIALIFIALAAFLVYIERKLKKIEDKVNGL